MPHSVAEKETNNYTWGTVCFFFFLYACDASIRKLLSNPSTTTTKKTIELCASKVLFHRVPSGGVDIFRVSRVLTGMAGFTDAAQVAGNLSPVQWRLLLPRDWGSAPNLAPSLPQDFFHPLSHPVPGQHHLQEESHGPRRRLGGWAPRGAGHAVAAPEGTVPCPQPQWLPTRAQTSCTG